MQASKWPLTTWFLVFDLIGQAKTGISSLELSRHLGVNDDTALLHNKILRAMTEREEAYLLRGKIQIDDSYLGGTCFGFNRRFSLATMTEQIASAVCCCMPCSERDLRVAEFYG